jgi:HK97 gp10 family phage protein
VGDGRDRERIMEIFSATSRKGFYTGVTQTGSNFGTITITGLRELKAKLHQISEIGQTKILDDAVKEGAKVIKNAIKAKTPTGKAQTLAGFGAMGVSGRTRIFAPGRLKKSIIIRKPRGKSSSTFIRYQIGPDKDIAFYAHMVEFGTSQHTIKAKRGKYLRFMRTSGFPYRPQFISEQTYATAFGSGQKVGGGVVFVPSVEVKARAHPFVRPGFGISKFAAVEEIRRKLAIAIERANRGDLSSWGSMRSFNAASPSARTEFSDLAVFGFEAR